MSTFQRTRRKQAAQPVPGVPQIRDRAIRRLLALAETDENPTASIAACRALLDLPAERESPAAENALSSDERRLAAHKIIEAAFEEIMSRPPPEPIEPPAPAPLMLEAMPEPAAEGNGEAVPLKPPIPFAQRYGRRLNRGY